MAHAGGRPPRFTDAIEFEELVQHYFDSITKTEPAFDAKIVGYEDEKKKKPIYEQIPRLNNAGEQIQYTTYLEIPSITGLCLYLKIARSTLFEYEKNEEYSNTIKEAKARIEQYNVEQLYRRDQVAGVIFNLKNNFGWTDKTEVDQTIRNPEGESLRIESVADADKIITDLLTKYKEQSK